MPPKDSTKISAVYIGTSEGLHHLGDIDEIHEVEDKRWTEPWLKENPYLLKQPRGASATITENVTKEQYEAFYRLCLKPTLDWWEQWKPLVFKLWAMGVTACHYIQAHPRVAYRALHGKPRVRKKNLHRILKEMRKEAKP